MHASHLWPLFRPFGAGDLKGGLTFLDRLSGGVLRLEESGEFICA